MGSFFVPPPKVEQTGGYLRTVIFTVNGNYLKNPAAKRIRVTCIGGGASGAGAPAPGAGLGVASSGGSGGCLAIRTIEAAALADITAVVVGLGGGPVSGGNGVDGGTTSFGAHCVAPGGQRGVNSGAAAIASAQGGLQNSAGITGDIRMIGNHGGDGYVNAGAGLSIGGHGGAGFFGGAANRITQFGATGDTSSDSGNFPVPGSGGGGGSAINPGGPNQGGPGRDGICIIEEFG
jgi:hypothetical protein